MTAAIYLFILFGNAPVAEKIIDCIVFICIAAASYFHIKHMIIPDVEHGIVNCLRTYNILAFTYGILCTLEIAAAANGIVFLRVAACLLECVVSVLLIIAMDKGVRKWSL